eukprot:2541527-Pyramimonas_sp.AAC.1
MTSNVQPLCVVFDATDIIGAPDDESVEAPAIAPLLHARRGHFAPRTPNLLVELCVAVPRTPYRCST